MDTVISVITAWKELITKVFSEYPLAASLITIVAIGFFFLLEKKERQGKTATNILLVLLGWVMAVPILGFVLTVLSKLWSFIETAVPVIARALGSFYEIYEKHPFLVLGLLTIGVLAYPAWKKAWPTVLPNRGLRIAILAISVFIAAHIADPIANALYKEQAAKVNNFIPTDVGSQSPKPSSPPAVKSTTTSNPAVVRSPDPPMSTQSGSADIPPVGAHPASPEKISIVPSQP